MQITLKDKVFKLHQTGLWVAMDGEVYMDIKCDKYPDGHFTYGSTNNRGYKRVKYKGKLYSVHRLVAECFIPNPDNYVEVDHIDRDKENNNIDNLRWADRSIQLYNRKLPKNNAKSKPVLQYTPDGQLVKEWPSIKEAGRNGFDQRHIWKCCNGKYKTHRGYKWKYIN